MDGDGADNLCDGCPNDPNKIDAGVCGCGSAETDTDGDGMPDCIDPCPFDPQNLDTDDDGTPDCLDGCPDDPNKTEPGVCGCSFAEGDLDEDGIADCSEIPAVSTWGLLILSLVLLAAAKIRFRGEGVST
jgi:hypothetical protein